MIENIVDNLNIPKDVAYGATILNIIGQYEIYVENYKNILLYDENSIKLQGRNTCILIKGKNLHIEYFNNEDMKVKGRISEISFC